MADANSVNPRFDNERQVFASDAPPMTKLVMLYLLSRTDKTGQIPGRFKVTVRNIMDATGIASFHTVLAALDDSRARGWVQWPDSCGRKVRRYTVLLHSPEQEAAGTDNGLAALTAAKEDGLAALTGASMLHSPQHVSEQSDHKNISDQRGADAPAPEPDGKAHQIEAGATPRAEDTTAVGYEGPRSGGVETPAPDSRPAARADLRKAVPAARPRVARGMKRNAEERAVRIANADRITALYWEKYGRYSTQTFMSVRSQLRGILANDVNPREIAAAVARLGKQARGVSRGTVQTEISKMRRERTPAAAPRLRDGAEDDAKYTVGFNGGKVLSI